MIKDIYENNKKLEVPYGMVIVNTGAGTKGVSDFFCIPGASSTILEANVTYSNESTDDFLLKNEIKIPEGIGYACKERAQYVAIAARSRAEFLISKKKTNMIPIGVGMTGAIITANPDGSPRLLRGGHRADITISIGRLPSENYKSYHLDLVPGEHTREEEETICGNFLKESIYNAFMENCFNNFVKYKTVKYIVYSKNSVMVEDVIPKNTIIFPGSFNPAHQGHYNLAKAVIKLQELAEYNVLFEISVRNVSKPALDYPTVLKRVQQFTSQNMKVVITDAPLFINKLELFPGCSFVLGYDTVFRLLSKEFYGWKESEGNFNEFLIAKYKPFINTGVRFYVAGRKIEVNNVPGVFLFAKLEHLRSLIPEELQKGFIEIPEELFREDISSTDIRKVI
jgi:hypothetical protein